MEHFVPRSWFMVVAYSLVLAGPILFVRTMVVVDRTEPRLRDHVRILFKDWIRCISRYTATTAVGYWVVALAYVAIMRSLGVRDASELEGSGMEATAFKVWMGLIAALFVAAFVIAWRRPSPRS